MIPTPELPATGCAQVIDVDLEAVESQSGDDLQPIGRPDLILNIERSDIGLDPIVRIAGEGGESDGGIDSRIIDRKIVRVDDSRGLALVARFLVTDFEAEQQGLI